jgi:hypothetical protein
MLILGSTLPAQVTRPSATAPARDVQLDGGRVRIALPDGWERTGEPDPNGLKLVLQKSQGPGLIAINIDQQQDVVVPEHARKMARAIDEQIRANAQTNHVELLYGPKLEVDPRFFLKINTRMNVPDRGIVDETHIYRVMGLNLVYLNVTTDSDSEDEARAVRQIAEALLAGAKIGAGPRPSSFPRTRLKVFVPPEWKEQRSDNPNDVVATWSEPRGGLARIVLKARVVPRDARAPDAGAQRDALLSEMIRADEAAPPISGLAASGSPEASPGDQSGSQKVTRHYEQGGKKWLTESRYLVVGDAALSLTGVAPEDSEFNLSELINEMAARIETTDRRARTQK